MSKARKKLRELLASNKPLLAPCAYDAISAVAIEHAGFELAGTTGFGMHAAMLGTPDLGLLDLSETVDSLMKMTGAVSIPVMADGEGGFGGALNVIRTVREYEKAGVAGMFIEDQTQPPNCPFIAKPGIIPIEEMVGKIKAALDAREDPDMVLIARTDAPYEEAIERANIYLEAGADMVKIVPKSRKELENLPARVNGPIHLGFFTGKNINDGLTAWDAIDMGYKIVTFPPSLLSVALASQLSMLKHIMEKGTDEGYTGLSFPLEQILNVVHIEDWKKLANKYAK